MNKRCLWFVALTIGFCSCVLDTLQAQQIQVNKENRTIAITANETATQQADVAIVSVGFDTYAKDAQSAYASGSSLSNGIIRSLRDAGVSKDDIRSESQNLSQQDPTEHKISLDRQFELSQRWQIKAKAEDAAKVLDLAIKAGANDSGGISWTVANEDTLTAKAADIALQKARTVAEQMAKGLGTKLIGLIYASNQAPSRSVFPFTLNTESASLSASSSKAVSSTQPLAVIPDMVSRSATVYAVFAIE